MYFRYTELLKKQFNIQVSYGSFLNPFTETNYMNKTNIQTELRGNHSKKDVPSINSAEEQKHSYEYNFKSFPRWDLGSS